MPVDASVVGINTAVMPLAEKAFTLGGIKIIVSRHFGSVSESVSEASLP